MKVLFLYRGKDVAGSNRVVVTQDIFGAWTAACFWGSTLNRFQQHRLVYAGSEAEAREKARRIVKKKKARGYGEIEC